MKTPLMADVENTGSTLLQLLSSFTTPQLNEAPFEGSWTAAQVAEHIWKAGDCSLLYGPARPVSRPQDEKTGAIKAMFLNFDIKMVSPEIIRPGDNYHQKETVLNNIDTTWKKLLTAADTLDLSEECTRFEVPGFGPFTRFEWVQFINVHTQRHIRQLQNIHALIV